MKVNIAEKLASIHDHWNPRIAGELNGQQVRLVKIQGDKFALHTHEDEDEMFFVVKGQITLEFGDSEVELNEGEFYIVKKGVEHRVYSEDECWIMLVEPKVTKHTGDVQSGITRSIEEQM